MSDPATPPRRLQRWLERQLPAAAATWLREQQDKLGG
jgi:hypothetical protein